MSIFLDEKDRLLTPGDVAKWAGISRSSVDRFVATGSLPKATYNLGEKCPRWTLQALQRHVHETCAAA